MVEDIPAEAESPYPHPEPGKRYWLYSYKIHHSVSLATQIEDSRSKIQDHLRKFKARHLPDTTKNKVTPLTKGFRLPSKLSILNAKSHVSSSQTPSLYNKTYTPKNKEQRMAKRGSSLLLKEIDCKLDRLRQEK